MRDTILLFESRELCYESNDYFMEQLQHEFENEGYKTEICDLSENMEEKLEELILRRQDFLAAFDFNSMLTRAELEDGTPYIDELGVPFFNYLVDHPLYHHGGLRRHFKQYSIICIDNCHGEYVRTYYPHIKNVFVVPLGAMEAKMCPSFKEKRFELLFMGTYVPAEDIYKEIKEYSPDHKKEVLQLLEWMEEDCELTQEAALRRYLKEMGEELTKEEFAGRLHKDYIVDRYLRFAKRKEILSAAAESGVPMAVVGHGLEEIPALHKKNVTFYQGVGFAVSSQMIADAKILLNITPGFLGGVHDRVYSARINRTLCFTEENNYTKSHFTNGEDIILYHEKKLENLPGQIERMIKNKDAIEKITANAYEKSSLQETWHCRAKEILKYLKQV